MATNRDSKNPQAAVTANDKAVELVQIVIDWYRGNQNTMTSSQQSSAITSITNVLNGTTKV